MKIGILGSGIVAQTLGAGCLAHGHGVMLGTRTPARLADWASKHPGGAVGTLADAGRFGDMLILAAKGLAASESLRAAGGAALGPKTVIDATNPIADAPPENGVLRFFTTLDESLMERLQREFPNLRFVKAFNSVGSAGMVNPRFAGGPPTMFLCGNDAAAKQSVIALLEQFGWEAADMGGAEAARAIEPLCMLWCIPGFLRQDWRHAFKLLT